MSDLSEREVRDLLMAEIGRAGSMRALAREWGCSASLLSEVWNGEQAPGRKVLEGLGLERVVVYRRKP